MRTPGPPFHVTHAVMDVDGTLVDFRRGMRAGLQAAAARIAQIAGTPVTVTALQAAREGAGGEPQWRHRSLQAVREESFRRVLAAVGVVEAAAVADVSGTYYRERNDAVVIYPDAREAMDVLSRMGVTLIAASNGNMDLQALGLAHYFAATQFAPQVGIAKPDPRFFSQAVAHAGGQPHSTLAVGDRLDNDYRPAVAADLRAVLVDRQGAVDDPAVLRISTLTELPALVAHSEPGG